MRVLMMGGTQFVGRAMTESLLRKGHQITHFNRGKTGLGLFDNVETIVGDRNEDLTALREPRWDVVVDVAAYLPDQTRRLNEVLADSVAQFVFVSTISVYEEGGGRLPEDAPRKRLIDDPGEVTAESYGPYKAICEDLILDRWESRATILRPGLICGPWDPTDRFTYWPVRYMEGGEILVPEAPELDITALDVRDLAEFTGTVIDRGLTGAFNCDRQAAKFGDLHAGLHEFASDRDFTEVAVPLDFLAENDISPWRQLPSLIPAGVSMGDSSKAIEHGLPESPLVESIRATAEWAASQGLQRPLKAGLSVEQECKVLEQWRDQ